MSFTLNRSAYSTRPCCNDVTVPFMPAFRTIAPLRVRAVTASVIGIVLQTASGVRVHVPGSWIAYLLRKLST